LLWVVHKEALNLDVTGFQGLFNAHKILFFVLLVWIKQH
jgi:hypothetical protein